MSEHWLSELGVTFAGVFLGFVFALVAYRWNENRLKNDRKKKLLSHIEKEIDGLISASNDPRTLGSNFKLWAYDATNKQITGDQLNLSLTAHSYLMNSESLGLFPYDIVESLSKVVLNIEVYTRQLEHIHHFNYETTITDVTRREYVASELISKAKVCIIGVQKELDAVKKKLEELNSS